jgi:F0F1-type ATP synthase membrane subunit a
MKGFIKRGCRYILKVLIVDGVLTGLAFVISYFSKMRMNDVLLYVGVICMLIGMLSMLGNNNNSVDVKYFISKSVGVNSINEITEENYKNRNKSASFMIFMLCVGGVFIAIVALIDVVLK